MSDPVKCHLCDRKKPEDQMQDIVVNGTLKTKACQTHEIDPMVMSYDFNEVSKKKNIKGPKQ